MGRMSKQRKLLQELAAMGTGVIFGGDPGEDPDDEGGGSPNPGDLAKKAAQKKAADPDDDDDDDDSFTADKLKDITDPKDRKIVELTSEAANRRRKARQHREEAERLAKELEQIKRKENDELTNTKMDLDKLSKSEAQWRGIAESQVLDLAILKDKQFQWHDIDTVTTQINREALEIDWEAGGKIEGLQAELARIAKEKPFLLKETSEDETKKKKDTSKVRSGSNPGGNRSDNDKVTQRADLQKKYGNILTQHR